MKHLWYILPLLLVFSCEDKKDTTPPEVTITSPSNGSTVNEVVNVTCMSTDNKDVSKVELWVDGVNTGLTDDTEPYSFIWNTTTYKDGDHTLIVRGYDTSDNEGDSPPITVKVDNTISVPKSISVKSVNFSNGGFSIDWSKSTDGDFKSYTLEHSIEPGMEDYGNFFTTDDVNVTNARMENVSPLTYHYFRVTVTDTFLYQTKGAIFTSKLDPIPDSVDVKSVTYDFEKMTVEWNKSSESDFDYYTVLWSKTENGNKDIMGKYNDINIVSHSMSSFDPTQENWFWVMVTDTLGQSKTGNGKTNTIDSPPTQSTLYPIKYDGSSFEISWSINSDNDFQKYYLRESSSSDMSGSTLLKEFTSQSDTTYIKTNVAYDQSYYYQVTTFDRWYLNNPSEIKVGSSYLRIVYSTGWDSGLISTIDIKGQSKKTFNVLGWEPTFSPDGKKILYVYEKDIHIMNRDGTDNKKLTTLNSVQYAPIFSPDGSKILYSENNSNGFLDVWIMGVDGSNKQQLTNTENYKEHLARITPDGTKIVFLRRYEDGQNSTDIFIMNIDGSNQTALTNGFDYNPDPFCITPDGSKVIFEARERIEGQYIYNIFSIKLDGAEKTNLTGNTSTKVRFGYPVISSDGTKIVYFYANGPQDIYVMDADGSNQTKLTNSTLSQGYFNRLDISPDGDKIASVWGSYNKLVLIGIDGSYRNTLTDGSGLYPKFEPRK
jgi:Tol biopolymer transport system component